MDCSQTCHGRQQQHLIIISIEVSWKFECLLPLGCELGSIPVSPSQADTTDVELSWDADWRVLLAVVCCEME
jgi:hypothetical protein